MALAGALEIQILAGIARLQADMTQAVRVVDSSMKSIDSSVAMAKQALGALGIGLGVGYFVSLIKGAIDAADHLHDLHKSTNIAVGDLAGLGLLAKQTGTDLDGLAKGINKMSVAMGKEPEKFVALGVTAKDNTEAFKQLADIFNLLPDIQQRNALAQAIFNRSWAEVAPALSEGGKKIGETIEKGKRLSGITEEMTRASDAFKDKLAEIGVSASGTTTRISGSLLPALTALVDNFTLVRNIALSLIAAKVAPWAVAQATALYGTVTANMAAAAATLATANANVVATGAAVSLTTARMAELRAAVIAAEGNVALAITTNGLVPMQARAAAAAAAHAVALDAQAVAARAASVSSGVAGAALGLLGGPIGWITLALGLGATAWAFWGKSAEDAATQAENAVERGLAVAKRMQEQSKFGTGEAGTLNEALSAARQNLANEIENFVAAEALIKTEADASSVMEKYSASIAGAQDVVDTLTQALGKATASTGGLTDEQKKAAAAAAAFLKEENTGVTETESAYGRLMKALEEKLLGDHERTEFAKLELELQYMTEKQLNKLTGAEIEALAVKTKMIDMMKREADALKAQFDYEDDLEKKIKELNVAIAAEDAVRNSAIKSASDQVELMNLETSLISATNVDRETAIFLRQAEIDKIDEATIARMKEAIAARDAAKQANDAQVSMWRSVEDAGHQAFLSIFDTSKSVLERIRAMLKTHLIDILYQMTVKKWIFNIVASISGAGVAQQAIGSSVDALSAVGTASNAMTGVSVLSNLWSNGMTSAMTQVGLQTGSEFALQIAAGMSGQAGSISAAFAASAGEGIGYMIPYVGWVLAAYALYKAFFGGHETVQGFGAATLDTSGAITTGAGALSGGYNPASVTALAISGLTQFTNTVTALGGRLSQTFGIGIGQGGGGEFNVVSNVGGIQNAGQAASAVGLTSEQAQLETLRSVIIGLQQAADFPDYLDRVFASINAGTSSQQDIQNTLAFASALKTIHDNLTETRPAFQIITDAAAALETTLNTSAGTFKTDFLAAIDAGITPEALANWQQLAGILDTINATNAKIAETRQGWQDQLDVLERRRTQTELDRANQLAGVTDEATRAIMRQVFAAQDHAAANTASADAAKTAADAERSLADARIAANDSVIQTLSGARNAVWQAYDTEAQKLQTLADSMKGFGKTLHDLQQSLLTGPLSPLAPMDQFGETQRQFRDLARRAQLGDPDALAQLGQSAQSYLQSARGAYSSGGEYNKIFAEVQAALGGAAGTADRAAENAAQQISLMQSQVEQLVGIRYGVESLDARMRMFSDILREGSLSGSGGGSVNLGFGLDWARTQLAAPQGWRNVYDLLIANHVSAAEFDAAMGLNAGTTNAFARSQGLPAFEHGTSYVPRTGLALVHQGESITPAGGNAELLGVLNALRAEVQRLTAVVAEGESANVAATDRVSQTQRDVAWRREVQPRAA